MSGFHEGTSRFRWVTAKELSRLTGLAPGTLANWRHLDQKSGSRSARPGFPVYRRFGRAVRYLVDESGCPVLASGREPTASFLPVARQPSDRGGHPARTERAVSDSRCMKQAGVRHEERLPSPRRRALPCRDATESFPSATVSAGRAVASVNQKNARL